MSSNVHGTPKGSTILWATLIIATLLTWSMGAPSQLQGDRPRVAPLIVRHPRASS